MCIRDRDSSLPLTSGCDALRRAIAKSIAHGKRNVAPRPLGARWEQWQAMASGTVSLELAPVALAQ
eukprot:4901016-Alexandrium_andersonii.AAC.1